MIQGCTVNSARRERHFEMIQVQTVITATKESFFWSDTSLTGKLLRVTHGQTAIELMRERPLVVL